MENALGLAGYQSTMMIIVFAVLGLGIAALFAALFLPSRWRLPYSMEFVFVGLLIVMVWYGDSRSSEIFAAYQAPLEEEGVLETGYDPENQDFDEVIRVLAFQWGFAFINEDDEISRNAAVVQPGERVMFSLFANDVIHGFNIPAAGITAEFEPGAERNVWILAPEEPGRYLIQCLNYCGVGHAQMKAWLVVAGDEVEAEA